MTEVTQVRLGEEEQIVVDGNEFPKVYELASDSSLEECIEWVKANKEQLDKELVEHGAFVFRGFPIKEIPQFHDFMLSFGWDHSKKFVGLYLSLFLLIVNITMRRWWWT